MDLAELKRKTFQELMAVADELGLDDADELDRQELVEALLHAQSDRKGEITAEGVIEVLQDGFGFLRAADNNYLPGTDDIYVSPSQIRRFGMRTGDTISGQVRPPKESERYFALLKVRAINGEAPERERQDVLFESLTPIHPSEPLRLETEQGGLALRIVELVAPIGFGQRCLVVAPPRAGKTTLLRDMARALERNHPEASTLVLVIDERPEEVTEMRRAVTAEVVSSTFDEPASRHVQVAEIVLAKARRLAESGKHAVVLLDSITRLARAYDGVLTASGKTSASGLDAAAVHKAKRFLGAARNLEEGGSLTVIATMEVSQGSAADGALLTELVGASNAEIHLDHDLADKRVFPGIDVLRSATSREEYLVPEKHLDRLRALRSDWRGLDSSEALARLCRRLTRAASNEALIESLGKRGASRGASGD